MTRRCASSAPRSGKRRSSPRYRERRRSACRRDLGCDVVDHQAADRRVRNAGERHAHQAAEGGPDPIEALGVDAGGEHGQVEVVLKKVIVARVCQPVAAAAADEVGADDTTVLRKHTGERVEVAAVARQAMHAEGNRSGRFAPIAVGDAMVAVAADAADALVARLRDERSLHPHGSPVRMASRRRRIERSRLASSAPKRRRVKGSRV